MTFSRRNLLAAAGAAPLLTLAPPITRSRAFATPGEADLGTARGWLSWVRQHRDTIALAIDDGRGHRLEHRSGTPQPLASAVKVLHLAAYATAVADGRLDPDERIRVGDWERFYVPMADGGAHVPSLRKLGIPADSTGLFAANPDRRVALDELVGVMIEFSDSAVPDMLRERLGDAAVRRAGRSGGWRDPDIGSLCGEYLFVAVPEHAPPRGTPLPRWRMLADCLQQRYTVDPALRERVRERMVRVQLPPYPAQCRWASHWMASTATQLGAMHRALSTSTFRPRRAAEIARRHLERPYQDHLPPGVIGIGLKSGNLPGMLAAGMSVRRADGTTGTGALLVHGGLSKNQLLHGEPDLPLLLALNDPAWRDRLADALAGSGTLNG